MNTVLEGLYSLVNSVPGDTYEGDRIHYDNGTGEREIPYFIVCHVLLDFPLVVELTPL